MAPKLPKQGFEEGEAKVGQRPVKHKRRYCRVEGCERIVKSQGVCQRHGAKAKLCRIEGCTKQAQGNFNGMCKSHFKAKQTEMHGDEEEDEKQECKPCSKPFAEKPPSPAALVVESVYNQILPSSISCQLKPGDLTPLARYLKAGSESKPEGWHRNDERLARGMGPIINLNSPFELWEQELVRVETLILTGNGTEEMYCHFARAWGRNVGFHTVVVRDLAGDGKRDVDNKRQQFVAASRCENMSAPSAGELTVSFATIGGDERLLKESVGSGIMDSFMSIGDLNAIGKNFDRRRQASKHKSFTSCEALLSAIAMGDASATDLLASEILNFNSLSQM